LSRYRTQGDAPIRAGLTGEEKGVTAYITKAIPFTRRFDRWLLLRAPLLWRTRLPSLLVLLSLGVIVAIPFVLMLTSIEVRTEVVEVASKTLVFWRLQLYGAVVVLVMWVRFIIIRKPVEELAPRRHIVTVLAVTIGSYFWLVTPSVLAYQPINAIKRVGPSDQKLNADLEVVSHYSKWDCVPPDVLNNTDELEKLRNVLLYYSANVPDFKREKGKDCASKDAISLGVWSVAYDVGKAIDTIREARGFNTFGENRFDAIRINLSWGQAFALGIGMLTAILSYPGYVWRRIFLR
jgi:hypothetical protein